MHLRVFLSSTPFPPRKNYNHVTEDVNLSAVRCLIHIVEAEARATEQKIPPDYRSSIPWNFSYARVSSRRRDRMICPAGQVSIPSSAITVTGETDKKTRIPFAVLSRSRLSRDSMLNIFNIS